MREISVAHVNMEMPAMEGGLVRLVFFSFLFQGEMLFVNALISPHSPKGKQIVETVIQ